jgi:MFS family permease
MCVISALFALVICALGAERRRAGGTQFRDDQRFLGWIVATFPFARALAAEGFFKVCFKYNGSPRAAMLVSLAVCAIGNSLYSLVDLLPFSLLWLLFSRFLVGFSAGVLDLYKDYLTRLSDGASDVRTFIAAAQGLGVLLGPGPLLPAVSRGRFGRC